MKYRFSTLIRYLFFLFILSVLDLLLFSYATSPLFESPSRRDSGMFLTIGKYWAEGFLPYIELWDSKGPIIFFVNALGYWVAKSRFGVFLIQVFCFFIANYYHYRTLLLKFNPQKAFIWTVLIMLSMNFIYDAGDTVEEFILPLLSASVFYLYRWSMNIDSCEIHPPKYALLYGVVLAFALFSRLTNAIGICAATLFIVILLCKRRKWNNLLHNAVFFVLGFLLISVPFVAYFYEKGALSDMWYSMFTYNLEYVGSSSLKVSGIKSMANCLSYFLNCWMLIAVASLNLIKNISKLRSWMWLSVSCLTIFMLFNTNGYGHYGIITLPYMAVAMNEMETTRSLIKGCVKKVFAGLTPFYGFIVITRNVYWIFLIFHLGYLHSDNALKIKAMLEEKLPKGYQASFIAYEPADLDLYLHLDVKPYYKFFVLQKWAGDCGPSLRPQIENTFRTGDCKYILTKQGEYKKQLQTLVGKRYQVKYENKEFCILELNDNLIN